MPTKPISQEILNVFAQLINETHDLFMVLDTEWTVMFANNRAVEYFDNKSLVGQVITTVHPKFKDSQLYNAFRDVITTGKSAEFEAVSPLTKRWMYYRVYFIENMLAVYATDINLRKEAQRTIQQNQERYFNFIAQSTEGIWRFELEEPIPITLPIDEQVEMAYQHGYLAECNDAMARMYGFNNAYDLMGFRLEMLLPKDPDNLAYLQAFMSSGYKLYDAESKEVARDGSPMYMLNNLMGIVENGHIVRAWGTQRNITRIKEVEEKLKDAQSQLNLALKAGSAGTFIWNIKTNAVQWTREEEALYGLPEGSFGGQFDNWARAVHPDDLQGATTALQHAISNGTELDIEFRILWPDQSIHWILAKGMVEYDGQGQPERVIGINIDITARKTESSSA